MKKLVVTTLVGDYVKVGPRPSPYFTYDANGVITGLHQGSPNVWAEGTYTDYSDWEYADQHDGEYPEKPYSGWTYGGSDVVENYATAIGDNAFADGSYVIDGIPPSKAITGNITFQNITSIGNYAFYNCSGLTSVTIGNGVTSIGASAFSGCSGLTNVTIPDGVTSIGSSAFGGCSGLTSVTIPDSVTSIGWEAFSGCSGLTSVTIPDSVEYIEEYAFDGCSGLTSITIGSGIQTIGTGAFGTYGSSITLNIAKPVSWVETRYENWYLPSGSTIVCEGGDTISIE